MESLIPDAGLGLFVWNGTHDKEILFEKGETIAPYLGDVITERQCTLRYFHENHGNIVPYGITTINGNIVDGALYRGPGSYVNHCEDSNCEYVEGKNEKIFLVALRDIKNGEELYVDYGENYFYRQQNVTSKVVLKKGRDLVERKYLLMNKMENDT